MKLHKYTILGIIGAAVLTFAACSDSGSDDDGDGHNDGHSMHDMRPAECQSIIDACHSKDDGNPGRINDCHEFGHTGSQADCATAVSDGCITDCEAAPDVSGGHGMAGGHGDHDHGDHMHGM